MKDIELERIIEKSAKLLALHRARARVRQLERELSGAPARAEESLYVPEFLRRRPPFGVSRLPSAVQQRAAAAPETRRDSTAKAS